MRVKVWNDNPHTDWNEKFKGEDVKIPSGKFIEMEFYEANEFKGQFSPIKIRGDDTQDPKSFKMIRIEQLTQEERDEIEDGQEVYQCNLCKKTYTTEASLMKHSEAQHGDAIVVDHDAEKAIPKKRGRPSRSQLEAQE